MRKTISEYPSEPTGQKKLKFLTMGLRNSEEPHVDKAEEETCEWSSSHDHSSSVLKWPLKVKAPNPSDAATTSLQVKEGHPECPLWKNKRQAVEVNLITQCSASRSTVTISIVGWILGKTAPPPPTSFWFPGIETRAFHMLGRHSTTNLYA